VIISMESDGYVAVIPATDKMQDQHLSKSLKKIYAARITAQVLCKRGGYTRIRPPHTKIFQACGTVFLVEECFNLDQSDWFVEDSQLVKQAVQFALNTHPFSPGYEDIIILPSSSPLGGQEMIVHKPLTFPPYDKPYSGDMGVMEQALFGNNRKFSLVKYLSRPKPLLSGM